MVRTTQLCEVYLHTKFKRSRMLANNIVFLFCLFVVDFCLFVCFLFFWGFLRGGNIFLSSFLLEKPPTFGFLA